MDVQGCPPEISADTVPSSMLPKALERMRKKWSWLSKFAGWSGHAALISLCPDLGFSTYA